MKRESDEEIIKRIKKKLQKETEEAIKSQLCKKCDGVIVRSFVTAQMAMHQGKRCNCKKPSRIQKRGKK